MRKYLKEYLEYAERRIQEGRELELFLKEHLDKISFMQHERLVHFLVTMLFVIIFFMCLELFLFTENISLLILTTLVLGLIIPYICHYYFLENNVQKMYFIYDSILEKIRENKKSPVKTEEKM